MDKYIEYNNIHDKICDVDIDIIYIAYIKTKEPYLTIELLKKYLIYEGVKLEDVKIYKKVIETKTRYEEIE